MLLPAACPQHAIRAHMVFYLKVKEELETAQNTNTVSYAFLLILAHCIIIGENSLKQKSSLGLRSKSLLFIWVKMIPKLEEQNSISCNASG